MRHLPVKLTKSSGKAESTSRFGGGASPDGASAGRLLPPAGASMSIIHTCRAVGDILRNTVDTAIVHVDVNNPSCDAIERQSLFYFYISLTIINPLHYVKACPQITVSGACEHAHTHL